MEVSFREPVRHITTQMLDIFKQLEAKVDMERDHALAVTNQVSIKIIYDFSWSFIDQLSWFQMRTVLNFFIFLSRFTSKSEGHGNVGATRLDKPIAVIELTKISIQDTGWKPKNAIRIERSESTQIALIWHAWSSTR